GWSGIRWRSSSGLVNESGLLRNIDELGNRGRAIGYPPFFTLSAVAKTPAARSARSRHRQLLIYPKTPADASQKT
ncbi:hypothetical protein ACC697_37980, partial [Rhizobium ruizarguesonis]